MAEGSRSELARDLERARRQLAVPPLIAGLLLGPLALYYAALVVQLPPGAARVLGWTAVALLPLLASLAFWRLGRQLEVVGLLAAEKASPTPENLKAALREIARLPDYTFLAMFQHWALGLVFLCVPLKVLVPEADWGLVLRLCALGGAVSPLTGFFSQLLTAVVGRRVLARLCREGLSPRDVFEAIPPRRFRLRVWLVFLIISHTLTPMLFIMDASVELADTGMARILAAADDPKLQRAIADDAARDVGVPVAVLVGLAAVMALGAATVVGGSLRGPMRHIAAQATRITEGRLDRAKMVFAEDEIWVVSATFSQMQDELSTALTQLQQAGLRLSTSSEQLVDTFGQQESGAAEQASALNETSATTEELARSAAQIAENAGSVAEVAGRTLQAARNGQRSADDFFASMQRMRSENQSVADSVLKLNKRVQQIGKIVEFIHGIADKSDLLALNAELEGTKAGEVGRGFSLVAAEMRRLAENVLKSTQEIERLIQEIRDATHAAVMATEAGMKATERGSSSATSVRESLNQIVVLASSTSDAVRSISLATQQQQSGTDQLADAMADILRVTQQSSAATRQMSSANLDLAALAKDLKAVVDRFQVTHV
jgi:methyl-accepting chemotaxis protein